MKKSSIVLLTVLGISLALSIFSSVLPLITPSYRAMGQVWRGYYTVLVERGEAYERFLSEGGWSRILPDPSIIVSEETQTVAFSTFEGLERVGVKKLPARFDPQDPRLDPYMQRLQSYFADGNGWMRLYIPARVPILHLFLKLRTRFPGYGKAWRLADFNLVGRFVSILLASGFCVTLFLMRKDLRLRWFVPLGFIPWFFTLLSGDVYDLIAYYLLFSGWFLVYEESFDRLSHFILHGWLSPEDRDMPYRYIYLGSAFLAVILLRVPSGRFGIEFLRTFTPLFASFCLLVPYVLWLKYQQSGNGHLPFSPVRILRRGGRERVRGVCLIVLSLHIVATPGLLRVGRSAMDVVMPVPRPISGLRSFNWDTLEVLWKEKGQDVPSNGGFPDLSDYVTHMVYQEGMVFGMPYIFPVNNRDIVISEYRLAREDQRIRRTERVIKSFNEVWLRDLFVDSGTEGIERMLLKQGRPVQVVLLSVGSFFGGFSFWKYGVLVLFAYFVLFSFDLMVKPVLSCSDYNPIKTVKRRAA